MGFEFHRQQYCLNKLRSYKSIIYLLQNALQGFHHGIAGTQHRRIRKPPRYLFFSLSQILLFDLHYVGTRDGKKEIRGGFTSDVIITPGAVVDAEHERRN